MDSYINPCILSPVSSFGADDIKLLEGGQADRAHSLELTQSPPSLPLFPFPRRTEDSPNEILWQTDLPLFQELPQHMTLPGSHPATRKQRDRAIPLPAPSGTGRPSSTRRRTDVRVILCQDERDDLILQPDPGPDEEEASARWGGQQCLG